MSEQAKQETFSEQMDRLREQADNIGGSLDTLIKCKEAGNLKQVAYWVGQVSRQVGNLCKECLGEEMLKAMLKAMKERERSIIS